MKVLVTGGAGYIGSHTCKLLAERGHDPIVYDNLSRGNKWAVKWGPLEIGDIRNKNRLIKVINKYEPDAVIHFAAFAYVGESVENPMLYYNNNVAGSISLLEAMIESGVKNIIFSSTCATYGIPSEIPITENHHQKPINPYGKSKLMIEMVLEDYSKLGLINYIILRYFNAAGADPELEIGEWHEPETHLIPLTIQAALGLREDIKIFGTDYPTNDGTCIRDYIHVSDLAKAHVKALEYLTENNISNSFNLGNEKGYSVIEVINSVKKISKKNFKVTEFPRREGDPPILISDSKKAKNILIWESQYKDIDYIVETAWKWYRVMTNS